MIQVIVFIVCGIAWVAMIGFFAAPHLRRHRAAENHLGKTRLGADSSGGTPGRRIGSSPSSSASTAAVSAERIERRTT